MTLTSAVILAAGCGSRLGPLTLDRPKALLDVGGRTLVDRQLDALASCGIRDVTVVIGHGAAAVRRHLGGRVRYVENSRYRDTNSLYSLWLARAVLERGLVVLNSDVLVPGDLLPRLCAAPSPDAALVDFTGTLGDEEMKVSVWHDFIVNFGKDLAPAEAHGENVGILKFGPEGAQRLARHLDALVAEGHTNVWAPLAFRRLAQEWPITAVATNGAPWTEIDFPGDLRRAEQLLRTPVPTRVPS